MSSRVTGNRHTGKPGKSNGNRQKDKKYAGSEKWPAYKQKQKKAGKLQLEWHDVKQYILGS